MHEMLYKRLAALTDEEKRLLSGEPLKQADYTSDASFLIAGKRLIPPSQLITLRTHTRFAAFPLHRHDYVEMMYVVTGSAVHTMEDGERVRLSAGELLLINCRTAHSIARCGENDVAVNFIVQPAFFDYALDTIGAGSALGQFLIDALRSGEGRVPYLCFRVAQVMPVQCVLESMICTLVDGPAVSPKIQKSAMALLFLHLIANTEHMTLSQTAHRSSGMVVQLLEAIQHEYQNISFAAFAAEHRVSAAYVSRTVKQATGHSCTELLQRRRLEKAKQLLRETELSILEVCAAVGYSNTSYFYRLFRLETGTGPSEYREQTHVNSGRE